MKNTEDNALISMISIRESDGETDKTELSCTGKYYIKDEKIYITYTEEDGTRILIKVCTENVSVRRMGQFGANMEYEPGKQTEFMYRTPYGAIPMKIYTHYINSHLNENGGNIEFSYSLEAGGGIGENTIKLRVKRD